MKFHSWMSHYDAAKVANLDGDQKREAFYQTCLTNAFDYDTRQPRRTDPAFAFAAVGFALEANWYCRKRPYFNVWPAISEALCGLDLSKVSISQCSFPEEVFSIQFCVGREPIESGGRKLQSMLVDPNSRGRMVVRMEFEGTRDSLGTPDWISAMHRINEPLEAIRISDSDFPTPHREDLIRCFQLVAAIGLMANDPEIIQPEVLTADESKYAETHSERLVEKAIQRGKYGWNIGKAIEYMPHYRRPHFGLRWTGTGGKIPKIVPIKGAIVKREKMTEVPTGYLDLEEASK